MTRSGPSVGLVTVTSAWKTGSPMAMPPTTATVASSVPPEVTEASTWRGVSPTTLKIAKSRTRSRMPSSKVVSRLTRPMVSSRASVP